jgi:outer membrane protein assembly factor BamD
MKKTWLYLAILALLLTACGDFEKITKNPDSMFKYQAAKAYFEKKQYSHAISLLEDIAPNFKGTEHSEDVLLLTAKAYMGEKDYFSASNYYSTYVKTFPNGKHTEECRYMIGYCYYLDSPDARLDQTSTIDAISSLEEFMEIYPQSTYTEEASKLIKELKDKLSYKAFLNAKLYFDLGNYLGDNYRSAVITAKNAIKIYPNSKYREDFYILALRARYQEAQQSIASKKPERFSQTADEYLNYINEYPQGKFVKEAQRIYKTANTYVKN